MISDIVNLFRKIAEKHVLIKSFKYDTLSKGIGIGNEQLSQLFLEDPIYLSVGNNRNCTATINFDVLVTPHLIKKVSPQLSLEPSDLQSVAQSIAMNIISLLDVGGPNRHVFDEHEDLCECFFEMDSSQKTNAFRILSLNSFSILPLNRYSDNNCYGVRVTLSLTITNDLFYCDLLAHFTGKGFKKEHLLPHIDVDNPKSCCDIFVEKKLPHITL